MKTILIAGAAMALISIPAQAQLLGGGVGGALGGAGAVDLPSLPSTPSLPDARPDLPATRGAVDGAASATGSAKADRRSGKVDAHDSGNAAGSGSLTNPLLAASGSGSAAGDGSASAQLVGTDAVRGAAQSTRSAAGSAVQQARGTAGSAAGTARTAAGSAAGRGAALAGNGAASAQGAANGAASAAYGSLAVAGSAAASGSGAFAIDKGMPVLAPDGSKIGKVRQIVADSQGHVQQVLVKVHGKKAMLPAANFSGSGSALVSAMGESSIKQAADQQDGTGANAG